VAIAVYEGLVTFLLFKNDLGSKPAPSDLARARTVAFTGLILIEMINVFNFRSLRHPLSRIGFFTNPKLLAAVVGSIALQVAVVYAPVMQRFFGTRSLDLREWLMMILLGLPIFLVPEGAKILLERRAAHTRKVRTRGASESER
jgi:magnesium-transporting ATPase (P-type)